MLMDPSYGQTSACPLPEGSAKGGSRKVKAIMNQLLSNLAPGGWLLLATVRPTQKLSQSRRVFFFFFFTATQRGSSSSQDFTSAVVLWATISITCILAHSDFSLGIQKGCDHGVIYRITSVPHSNTCLPWSCSIVRCLLLTSFSSPNLLKVWLYFSPHR